MELGSKKQEGLQEDLEWRDNKFDNEEADTTTNEEKPQGDIDNNESQHNEEEPQGEIDHSESQHMPNQNVTRGKIKTCSNTIGRLCDRRRTIRKRIWDQHGLDRFYRSNVLWGGTKMCWMEASHDWCQMDIQRMQRKLGSNGYTKPS